ncbi:hypothetical protein D5086_011236 [Populus alba]|uniref:Uncharacterized protein n=1 Tax=Populus alba TaxID=43335 RepID=A0ACC4CCS6_POPAL
MEVAIEIDSQYEMMALTWRSKTVYVTERVVLTAEKVGVHRRLGWRQQYTIGFAFFKRAYRNSGGGF